MAANKHWNDDWREELKRDDPACYQRLCDCKSIKKDLRKIAKLMYKYNVANGKEETLNRTIDWICDWNNQFSLMPDDNIEYDKLLESM